MAGYLIALGEKADAIKAMEQRVYSTYLSPKWLSWVEGTLGDYATMLPGDNVYFFTDRKIYGIGEILDIGSGQCVVENFPGATSADLIDWQNVANDAIYQFHQITKKNNTISERVGRWIIAFKPSPQFFQYGIDMDDLLESNPSAFRSLRVFWKRSFIKLDDEENDAFKTALIRTNIKQYYDQIDSVHDDSVPARLLGGSSPDIPKLLASKRGPDGSLSSESLLEAGILFQLAHFDGRTCDVFGKWSYLSRQVNASPFKPVDYMDRIDIFGYRWIEQYRFIIEKYLVVELKKEQSDQDNVLQVMKYVDWVNEEYAHGDYSLIDAFLVAHEFSEEVSLQEETRREYVVGRRPAHAKAWDNLKLVTYNVTEGGYIEFSLK